MATPPDLEAQILRYYHVEKWRIGTIARQLHIHHSVARVLAQAGLPRVGPPPRPSKIDAYLPFIRETLERFPTLTASRLYAMACERGYRGGADHFRHLIACHRPRPKAEAYLRLRTPAWRTGTSVTGDYAERGIAPTMPRTGLCRVTMAVSAQPDDLAADRHSLAPSNSGRRASMQSEVRRLWALAREPEGPLADVS